MNDDEREVQERASSHTHNIKIFFLNYINIYKGRAQKVGGGGEDEAL